MTDLKTLRSVATKAARRNWTDDDMQAFDDAFRPQAVLSLLDRVEALEGALTALQGERDRLREALTALVAAADAASWAHNIGTMDARIEAARAALHPEPLGEGGGL